MTPEFSVCCVFSRLGAHWAKRLLLERVRVRIRLGLESRCWQPGVWIDNSLFSLGSLMSHTQTELSSELLKHHCLFPSSFFVCLFVLFVTVRIFFLCAKIPPPLISLFNNTDSGLINSILLWFALTKGDTIGPLDVFGHQNLAVHSIQARLLNFSLTSPVRPVHEPVGRFTWRRRFSQRGTSKDREDREEVGGGGSVLLTPGEDLPRWPAAHSARWRSELSSSCRLPRLQRCSCCPSPSSRCSCGSSRRPGLRGIAASRWASPAATNRWPCWCKRWWKAEEGCVSAISFMPPKKKKSWTLLRSVWGPLTVRNYGGNWWELL